MSVDLIDKKTGEVFATCPDLAWALKHVAMWGLKPGMVDFRVNK